MLTTIAKKSQKKHKIMHTYQLLTSVGTKHIPACMGLIRGGDKNYNTNDIVTFHDFICKVVDKKDKKIIMIVIGSAE